MRKWPGRRGLECRDKGLGLETPVRQEEALEVGVGVVELYIFNLFKAQGRGSMEGGAGGDWNLLTNLSHVGGPHRVCMLCVFRGGVQCQPAVPPPS